MIGHVRFAHDPSHFLNFGSMPFAGVPRPVRESSSDESLEELEDPSEDESPKVSFVSLSVSPSLNCMRPSLSYFAY